VTRSWLEVAIWESICYNGCGPPADGQLICSTQRADGPTADWVVGRANGGSPGDEKTARSARPAC